MAWIAKVLATLENPIWMIDTRVSITGKHLVSDITPKRPHHVTFLDIEGDVPEQYVEWYKSHFNAK